LSGAENGMRPTSNRLMCSALMIDLLRRTDRVVRAKLRRNSMRPRTVAALGTVVSALMLNGCAVGPDFKSPEPPPAQGYIPGQVIRGSTNIPGNWWQRFRSPQLDKLIDDGIAYNSDLQAAEAAVRCAGQCARAARVAVPGVHGRL
jgi:hypothetical protein